MALVLFRTSFEGPQDADAPEPDDDVPAGTLRIVADRVRTSLSAFRVGDRGWRLGVGNGEVVENADKVIFLRR